MAVAPFEDAREIVLCAELSWSGKKRLQNKSLTARFYNRKMSVVYLVRFESWWNPCILFEGTTRVIDTVAVSSQVRLPPGTHSTPHFPSHPLQLHLPRHRERLGRLYFPEKQI